MSQYSDIQIINGVSQKNHKVILYVYKEYYGMIERMVINKGGDRERARDIFQEAMLVIYTRLTRGELKLSCTFSTYLYAVCKNLWYHTIRKEKEYLMGDYTGADRISESGPDEFLSEKINELFWRHFSMLTEDCKKLLELHFMKTPLDDITRIMGYSSEHYTADRKYKCKKGLINRIRSDPEFKKVINGIY